MHVDADDPADRCLCAARRRPLRPRLRAVAAVGLGGLRRRARSPAAISWTASRARSDLDHRRVGRRCGALASLLLQPLDDVRRRTGARQHAGKALLRDAGFWPSSSAALIQGSHVAYYIFASINWQRQARRADDRGPLDAGRDRRDRRLRAVAALLAASVDR